MIPLAQLTSGDDGLQAPMSTAADLPFFHEAEWGPGPAGLYIHVPFCIHKCHYCDFYSLVETGPESRQPAFTDRLIQEIRAAGPLLDYDDALRSLSPAERMALVWQLTLQCMAWTGADADEPRLQRSVCRVQRLAG